MDSAVALVSSPARQQAVPPPSQGSGVSTPDQRDMQHGTHAAAFIA